MILNTTLINKFMRWLIMKKKFAKLVLVAVLMGVFVVPTIRTISHNGNLGQITINMIADPEAGL
jgi:hypothetical protein